MEKVTTPEQYQQRVLVVIDKLHTRYKEPPAIGQVVKACGKCYTKIGLQQAIWSLMVQHKIESVPRSSLDRGNKRGAPTVYLRSTNADLPTALSEKEAVGR